jgi:hypothetical protein
MTDLAERLRQIERNPSPDMWGEITNHPVRSSQGTPSPSGWRRAAIIAASLALGLAAVAWIVVAIRPESHPPVSASGSIEVPNVQGMSPQDAKSVLVQAGLTPGEIERRGSIEVSIGSVIATRPPGGSLADPGTPITLIVSDAWEPPPEAQATRLPGIDAYRVCRLLSMPGDFGSAGDEFVVFEEERVPGAGCSGSEGFQHVAVLRDGQVTALSRRITDIYPDEVWRVWPYAAPDLDGDGVDEIAVALDVHGTGRRVWFFQLGAGGGGLDGAWNDQGPPFTQVIDATASQPQGLYCDGVGADRRVVTWVADTSAQSVVESRWRLETSRVALDSESTVPVGPQGYPAAGDQELCGSPVSSLDAYP